MTKSEKITWVLFALLIGAVYLFALDIPLLGPDEPRYSQVAREMYQLSDWVTPTLGGHNWFEKPALLYWLQIASYNLFGVNEFAARFGSALFGLGTILSLFILGRSIVSSKNSKHGIKNSDFPFWLALIAASSIGLIVFSRGASFDIIITFPITASLVSFFIWETKHRSGDGLSSAKTYVLLTLFYVFMGIGLIGKGLIGAVFPMAIVCFYYLLKFEIPSKTLILSLFWGAIVTIAVASFWYLPMYLANGWEFIDEFFVQHHFRRFASNKYKHPQPFWFFWVIFPLFLIPWIPFFLASLWQTLNGFIQQRKSGSDQKRITKYELRLFALSWMLVPLVFFSFSGSKLPGYILPAVPGAIILTAIWVYAFVQKSALSGDLLKGLAFLTFVVIIILLRFVVPDFAYADSTKGLMQTAAANGYANERIIGYRTVVHNIEFYGYGAARLARVTGGKQKIYKDATEIVDFLRANKRGSSLVLVQHHRVKELLNHEIFSAKELDKNAETTLLFVKLRQNEN